MLQLSQHQAAGHEGTLTDEDGSLFIKKTTRQEVEFYQSATKHDQTAPDPRLTDWMPLCLGELKKGVAGVSGLDVSALEGIEGVDVDVGGDADGDKTYIVLHNLYNNYKFPSILDIKLGSVLTDDDTTPEKVVRLAKVARETTSGSHNFRICGMKVYDCSVPADIFVGMDKTITVNGDYLEYNKIYGRSLDSTNIERGIEQYFTSLHDSAKVYCLLNQFHKRLQLLYNCLLDYEVRIFSGSLLFIYENDNVKWNGVDLDDEVVFQTVDPLIKYPGGSGDGDIDGGGDGDSSDDDEGITFAPSLSQMNLIDFAHSKFTPGQGHDENILQGVENLLIIFASLLQKYKPQGP